jgi:hypothetical protein
MNHCIKFFKTLHFLSLDVVAGAVISSWMFWKLPDSKNLPDLATLAILGCSTWLIYILDRLFDNFKTIDQSFSPRHQFHSEHQYYLQLLIILLALLALVLLFFIPQKVLVFGCLLLLLLGLYFYLLQIKSQNADYQYFKEIFTAILYSFSVLGSAYCVRESISFAELMLGFNFFLLTHQSILTFSIFELIEQPKTKNFAQKIGFSKSQSIVFLIVFWCFIWLIISQLYFHQRYIQAVFGVEFLMSFLTCLLLFFKRFFIQKERYRWLGELVFSIPLFLQIIGF